MSERKLIPSQELAVRIMAKEMNEARKDVLFFADTGTIRRPAKEGDVVKFPIRRNNPQGDGAA